MKALLNSLREKPWHVQIALLLTGVWAVWLFAFVVWALTVPELRSGAGWDASSSYAIESVVILAFVVAGLTAAVWQPGWGAVGGGLVMALLAGSQGGGRGVNGLTHWGDVLLGDQGRTTSWVPLDSISGVPYWVLLVASVLLVVGGVAHLRYPMDGYVRAAFLLVAVWAVWLTAFAGWAMNTKELGEPDNPGMGYVVFVWFLAVPVVASALLVAIAWPRWGAIGAGLGMTLGAAMACRASVIALRDWGRLTIGDSPDYGNRPWVLLDSIGTTPYWALLAAGVLLVVGGIVQVLHAAHGTTPHAGATT
jgi:hypothetical protein